MNAKTKRRNLSTLRRLCLLTLIFTLLLPSAAPAQAAVLNGWNTKKTVYYQNGSRYTGTAVINGKTYLFKRGKKQTGFQTFGTPKQTYYFKKSGAMVKGMKKIKGKTYYFSPETGAMFTGWMISSGKKYYFKESGQNSGQMVTGTLKSEGLIYWFNRKGELTRVYTRTLRKQIKAEKAAATRTKASSLAGLSAEQVIKKVGPLFTADQKNTGVLASVSLAQFILESGYGQSELAQKANNCFGMKEFLSGNTWLGTRWNGQSVYKKKTYEEDAYGHLYQITARFRRYSCIEDSIADHSAYLTYAMDGIQKRYPGLKGCTSYATAAKIILKGGYATDSSYVAKLCELITRWKLNKYNAK